MKRTYSHRGVTLIEVSVAMGLVAVMAGVILESQLVRGRLERAMRWRELAVVEAGNQMEQLTALDWNDLTSEKLATLKVSDDFHRAMPEAALHLSVDSSPEPPDSRRIRVEIDWPGPTAGAVRPVKLTSWVYRIEHERVPKAGVKP